MKSASRQTSNVNRSAGNVNRSNANVNRSGNRVNTGDVNVNVNRNVDIDNDCCDGGWGDNYHPVARGAAIAATIRGGDGRLLQLAAGQLRHGGPGGRQLLPVRVDLVPAGLFRVERAICGGAGALGGDLSARQAFGRP